MASDKPLIQIYSHVRSGTHFLEEFLAENFYSNKRSQLGFAPMMWGHWSDRKLDPGGAPLGKLFANHFFPDHSKNKSIEAPSIYIYRDGRSVALSTWKTPNFKNKTLEGISFSDYLRTNIDWVGSPSARVEKPHETIIEHWKRHVEAWTSEQNSNLLLVRYEDLAQKPEAIAKEISYKFSLEPPETIKTVNRPTGLLPNKASMDDWKNYFTEEDLRLFFSIVGKNFIGVYEE